MALPSFTDSWNRTYTYNDVRCEASKLAWQKPCLVGYISYIGSIGWIFLLVDSVSFQLFQNMLSGISIAHYFFLHRSSSHLVQPIQPM